MILVTQILKLNGICTEKAPVYSNYPSESQPNPGKFHRTENTYRINKLMPTYWVVDNIHLQSISKECNLFEQLSCLGDMGIKIPHIQETEKQIKKTERSYVFGPKA